MVAKNFGGVHPNVVPMVASLTKKHSMNGDCMRTGLIRTMLYSFVFASVSALLLGCAGSSGQAPSPADTPKAAQLPAPTKQIIVTKGDLNKPYNVLGEVKCSIDGKSAYGNYDDYGKEAEELCRRVAFSKYGDKVDAIINMDAALTINGGFWGQMGASYGARNGTVNGAGIAVQFK